jgi:hypothetical protein
MTKSLIFFFCVLLQSVTSFTPVLPTSIQTKTKFLSSSSFQLAAKLDDEKEYVKVPRRGGRRFYDDDEEEENSNDQRLYDDEDDDDEWDDDEDDDDDDEDEYGLFSNVIIDNPLLDSIDPDGAAERFPELAADPWFWFDMVLFIAFLNFLSAVGPQDYFPDIPWNV